MRFNFKRIVLTAGAFLLIFFASFSLYIWLTFGTPRIDEMYWVFYAPLGSFDLQFFIPVLQFFLVPFGIFSIIFFTLYRKLYSRFLGIFLCCLASIIGAFVYSVNKKSNILLHLSASSFIEDNYLDPKTVGLNFPKRKKNLIRIYVESMEVTYADQGNGGALKQNLIPTLTQRSGEGVSFRGKDRRLNGILSTHGSTWTIAAAFSQEAGLPLKVNLDGNMMDTQKGFFPDIATLGDILAAHGYTNVLLQGSDARFGGTKLFYQSHGNAKILDYGFFKQKNIKPDVGEAWWGVEDEKVFAMAKQVLPGLAREHAPFAFTLFTVDTHANGNAQHDGLPCRLCPRDGGNIYANVIRCSDAQLDEFISWVEKQEFYPETVIVISGDHLSMAERFFQHIGKDYERKAFMLILNAEPEPELLFYRAYTAFDVFPTILGALGVKISGNRLGLGANLYSDTPTLAEKMGIRALDEQLQPRSAFMERHAAIEPPKLMETLERKSRQRGKINIESALRKLLSVAGF